jgi:hypothetical protein
MTDADREMVRDIRRGMITIMRALMKRYGLSWADFLPHEPADGIAPLVAGALTPT